MSLNFSTDKLKVNDRRRGKQIMEYKFDRKLYTH